jgi:hypothetical protein
LAGKLVTTPANSSKVFSAGEKGSAMDHEDEARETVVRDQINALKAAIDDLDLRKELLIVDLHDIMGAEGRLN